MNPSMIKVRFPYILAGIAGILLCGAAAWLYGRFSEHIVVMNGLLVRARGFTQITVLPRGAKIAGEALVRFLPGYSPRMVRAQEFELLANQPGMVGITAESGGAGVQIDVFQGQIDLSMTPGRHVHGVPPAAGYSSMYNREIEHWEVVSMLEADVQRWGKVPTRSSEVVDGRGGEAGERTAGLAASNPCKSVE